MIKVAIVDDNDQVMSMIKDKLSGYNDISLTMFAENGRQLLEQLKYGCTPDLILLDIEMPELNGIETTTILRQQYPEIKIVMHTLHDDDQYIFEAFKNGAHSFILKDTTAEKLYEAIADTMKGGAAMSPAVAVKTIQFFRMKVIPGNAAGDSLSPRESEILQQIAKGRTNKRIADELFISPFTVKRHVENIYTKLRAENRVQLIQRAREDGLI